MVVFGGHVGLRSAFLTHACRTSPDGIYLDMIGMIGAILGLKVVGMTRYDEVADDAYGGLWIMSLTAFKCGLET